MIFFQIQTPDWCGLLRFSGWWTGAWIATCCVLLEVLQYRVSRSTGTQFTLYVRSQWRYLSFPIKHRNIDINCTTYHGFHFKPLTIFLATPKLEDGTVDIVEDIRNFLRFFPRFCPSFSEFLEALLGTGTNVATLGWGGDIWRSTSLIGRS